MRGEGRAGKDMKKKERRGRKRERRGEEAKGVTGKRERVMHGQPIGGIFSALGHYSRHWRCSKYK